MLIVSEDPLARSGLLALLGDRPGVRIAAAQGSPDDAPADADVAVWDFSPRGSVPALPTVALLPAADDAPDAYAAGARGALRRDVGGAALAAALRAVAHGLLVFDPAAAAPLLRGAPAVPDLLEPLTPREQETLRLLSEGLSNRRIAERLGVSEHTAKFHVNAILGKLGARTRTEAIVTAARLGLVVL